MKKGEIMRERLHQYKHAWVLLYFAIYLPWFFWLEGAVTSDYHVIHTWLDDLIPFNEYFIIPYFMWFLYVGGVMLFFFLKNAKDFYRLCEYLFAGMTLCLMVCTVFHNGTDLRPVVDPGKNFCCWLVSLLHQIDTSTNVFPSIHVFNSVAVHVAVVKSDSLQNRNGIHFLSLVLCVMICLSTMFLKQHSVMDVMGGLLVAYVLYPLTFNHEYAAEGKRITRKALG